MIDTVAWLWALAAAILMTTMGWCYAFARHNVNVIDTLWPLFFVLVLATYLLAAPAVDNDARRWLITAMTLLWALRLAVHLGVRNYGQPEDHRYAAIRARNEPGFAFKSLYLVFGLQAVLAWIIAAPLAAAASGPAPLYWLDAAGVALWSLGLLFESVADRQLARFKRDPANRVRVMDEGLWHYTRHPNYFGEACLWWGFWLVACAGGGAWTVYAPLLMTVLLLKVSGVALLEKDIAERRPGYREYVRRTNAFIPGPLRRPS